MKRISFVLWVSLLVVLVVSTGLISGSCNSENAAAAVVNAAPPGKSDTDANKISAAPSSLTLDTALYDAMMTHMVNGDSSGKWPVKHAYPSGGAILPAQRIIAYYGNLYSKQMGILGELPEQQMLDKLQGEVKKWQAADTRRKGDPRVALHSHHCSAKPGRCRQVPPAHAFQRDRQSIGYGRKDQCTGVSRYPGGPEQPAKRIAGV
jgi:hypothetical protein